MPAIQKIRKHGALLICIIGAALFAFITEEAVRSMQTTSNASKQQVGEVYGEALNYPEYMEMFNDAAEIEKLRSGQLSDAQNDQIRDRVWQDYVVHQLIKHETDKLGLYVTDTEVQNALKEGTAQSLQQYLPMFVQNGHFDVNALQDFNKQYNDLKGKMQGEQMEQFETIHRLWIYAEKQLRKELLLAKFQNLFMSSILANPVNAELSFNDRNTSTTALVAALPYVAIQDKVEVTDAELKDAYKTYKENFRLDAELRDIKYIDVAVTASAADKKALDKTMQETYEKLVAGNDPAAVVSSSNSNVRYVDMPLSANYFPADIRQQLDSMAVGAVKAPYQNIQDNTMNVIKLISKVSTPDTITYRSLFVADADEAKLQTRYDSIMNAINGGAKFKDLAKKYGQNPDSLTATSAELQQMAVAQPEYIKIVKALNETTGVTSVDINGGKFIIQVLGKKGSSPKYLAAVVKCPINFSHETYNDAKNKMNLFMANNKDLAAVEKAAAKAGYQVVESNNFSSASHNIGADGMYNPGISGTKDAVKWVFDEAKVGQISKMYECGEANNHILLVGLAGIHEKGYLPWDNKDVKEFLTAVVTAQKKGEIAAKKLANVKTIADAQKQGAVVDTLKNVNFFATPFIASAQAPEAKVAAALASLKVGATSAPVIGNAGAYVLQALSQEKGEQKFDKATEMQMLSRQYMQMAQGVIASLLQKANVIDRRYKF